MLRSCGVGTPPILHGNHLESCHLVEVDTTYMSAHQQIVRVVLSLCVVTPPHARVVLGPWVPISVLFLIRKARRW